jgi:TetR/AcrR family transcriptional regulator, regulator of cefoperazone and chloramphenicol sensitivity
MDTMRTDRTMPETRQRLLEAAGEVFAERGFRAATVREICHRAKANLAAINYHFGDKERLYTAVLQYTLRYARQKYFHPTLGLGAEATAEERLRAFIHSFLLRLLDEGLPAWHGKLMVREMAEPTQALDVLVEEVIRPDAELLMSIVHELLGRDTDSRRVLRCAESIVGQCLFYEHCRPVIMRLDPDQTFTPQALEQLADHITRFSLAALKQFAQEQQGEVR